MSRYEWENDILHIGDSECVGYVNKTPGSVNVITHSIPLYLKIRWLCIGFLVGWYLHVLLS